MKIKDNLKESYNHVFASMLEKVWYSLPQQLFEFLLNFYWGLK